MNETTQELSEFVAASAEKLGVPGVAVGVLAGGREDFACHGVTSVDNPLPVDRDTMFVVGSVSKTFTATALMRLVAEGRVELDAPVRRYAPEFVPTDAAADEITVLRLLNHTAGLEWKLRVDPGEGDDALARHAVTLAESPLIAPPGTRASYSQAGFNLAGRIIENVTGSTFEGAVASLLFEPLGLAHSRYAVNDVMTRRFAVGHNVDADGVLAVARQWKDNRSNNPGGGVVTSVSDLLRWARFHLGDGRIDGGERLLPTELLHRMRQPTVELRGSTLGDAFGICWFLREVDGVATIGHGGSGNGQFADLLIVPERNFAVAVTSNAGPDAGLAFNRAVVNRVLEDYLGVVERDPEPMPYDGGRAAEIVGDYENEIMRLTLDTDGAGMTIECAIKPEIRAAGDTELPPDLPPATLGLLPGEADEYIVTEGGLQGQRGFFTRDESGAVTGIDLAGRLFARVR
ncbi:serine hydrolase domain-containing protein [Nocardia arthritidis]|uniref:serine hydrolase domain-containing protein n=1 Tax=Nocardia arthritidis TaxID=228602 RepID=UPI0007A3BCDC|nr:serine hydrolase domain-containing protein [Nocardia arthritidis]